MRASASQQTCVEDRAQSLDKVKPQLRHESKAQALCITHQNPNLRSRVRGDLALRCEHCKKVGHQSDGCWFLHPQLRPIRAGRQCFGSENDKRMGELLSDTREEGNRQKKSDASRIKCGMDPSHDSDF
jgi:hypothetical protein